jgi:hypothetical protein
MQTTPGGKASRQASAAEAATLVKPGDWLDYASGFSQPDVFPPRGEDAVGMAADQQREHQPGSIRGWPPACPFTAKATSGARSTAAKMTCARSSAGSQSFISVGTWNGRVRAYGMKAASSPGCVR